MVLEQAVEDFIAEEDESANRAPKQASVKFTLKSPATAAYLLLASSSGNRILRQMNRSQDAWNLTLHLEPATYRYRYYVSHGRTTTYFSPSDAGHDQQEMDGMDAILDVTANAESINDRYPEVTLFP
jgi:hypothetical protein